MAILKKLTLVSGLALVFYLLSTSSYWVEQISYELSPPPLPIQEQARETMEPATIIIPSLGIQAPIVKAEKEDPEVFQEALQKGVVHYPGTAEIGTLGNPYLFGHSSDYIWARGDFKAVFATLPKIKKGDEIIASNSSGDKFVYTVTETLVASPQDTHLLGQYNYEKKLLTLQTSYPVGTAFKRFVVVAQLSD